MQTRVNLLLNRRTEAMLLCYNSNDYVVRSAVPYIGEADNDLEALNSAFDFFNNGPELPHRSASIGDVFEIIVGGDSRYYAVKSVGFQKLLGVPKLSPDSAAADTTNLVGRDLMTVLKTEDSIITTTLLLRDYLRHLAQERATFEGKVNPENRDCHATLAINLGCLIRIAKHTLSEVLKPGDIIDDENLKASVDAAESET